MEIAALFVRKDSIYKKIGGVECYDVDRDARTFQSSQVVIAHPPCRAWGKLRRFAKPRKGERHLATFAIRKIRENGGVLEHPSTSTLWAKLGIKTNGTRDAYGGYCLPIDQLCFGHKAQKRTVLYICGIEARELPAIPYTMSEATHVVRSEKKDRRPLITKAEREHTPERLALWLIETARRITSKQKNSTAR